MLQPARLNFLLSSFWHFQDRDCWPVFYVSERDFLIADGLFESQQDFAKDYLLFRKIHLELMSVLDTNTWSIEQLCSRLRGQEEKANVEVEAEELQGEDVEAIEPVMPSVTNVQSPVKTDVDALSDNDEIQASDHTYAQWMIAKIGKKFGCQVWIARNDHTKIYQNQALGDLSIETLPPLGLGDASQKIVQLIDVVWLKSGGQVVGAFEIECTTSIFSGLLRMSDLGSLSPNLSFPMYIVVPDNRLGKVKQQLSRPTFQSLELHQRCGFFSIESLEGNMNGMIKWASSPSAIKKLAAWVGDVADME